MAFPLSLSLGEAQPEGPAPRRGAAGGDTPPAAGPAAGLPPLGFSRRGEGMLLAPGHGRDGGRAEEGARLRSPPLRAAAFPSGQSGFAAPPCKAQRRALGEELGRTEV